MNKTGLACTGNIPVRFFLGIIIMILTWTCENGLKDRKLFSWIFIVSTKSQIMWNVVEYESSLK